MSYSKYRYTEDIGRNFHFKFSLSELDQLQLVPSGGGWWQSIFEHMTRIDKFLL
jgi:hypothetical protein